MNKIERKKVTLMNGATPFEPLANLTNRLGSAQLFIKRDDCTGLATGGNKTRKLEYLIADALQQKATVLVTIGGIQSNHARQTAAAANKYQLKCALVLEKVAGTGGEDYLQSGNLLLDNILGADTFIVPDNEDCLNHAMSLVEQLKAQGEVPYFIAMGGSDPVGACGYVECAFELIEQCQQQQLSLDALFLATGSAGTQAGLIAGMELLDADTRVIGVCVSKPEAAQRELIINLLEPMSEALGFNLQSAIKRIEIKDQYYGKGYGIPTDSMVEAVKTLARQEAILLDPVYTGKAMAGMLDMLKKGEFNADQNVTFLHTGGSVGLFAYKDLFKE
ncbi:D-cysteine desulfhydrase [Thalassotalea litorea]|uniref:D-cysteine desulfhydrase n=1 Tax=Thalassotalea litorea TaxID=2020715 RepID=A0A5R9IJ45_9GAMM|nr:D-cysteine desulfhydrase [Thalassotalea litorea]TLU61332.1 D-cysteine desulfhydrase [Thalassotalea litorea]